MRPYCVIEVTSAKACQISSLGDIFETEACPEVASVVHVFAYLLA